jgi:hypothetical protein
LILLAVAKCLSFSILEIELYLSYWMVYPTHTDLNTKNQIL